MDRRIKKGQKDKKKEQKVKKGSNDKKGTEGWKMDRRIKKGQKDKKGTERCWILTRVTTFGLFYQWTIIDTHTPE